MRVIRVRHRDERGIVGVWFAVLMVALFGILALSMDGGLLYVRFRAVRNGNDAAALAAALSCAKGEGLGTANSQAASYADENATGAWSYGSGTVYTPSCNPSAGKVTVHFGASQTLYFAPFVGVDSPRGMVASATAKWGAAAGATNIAPLMLSKGRLSTCDIPNAAVGTHCYFWWDNGTGNNSPTLTTAEWGLMDLTQWNVAKTASCPGNVNQQNVSTWIASGFPGTLMLNDPPPTYVCRGSGFQGNALNSDINAKAGQQLLFPVNDPLQQVDSAGNVCPPTNANCTVQKYAIVSFGVMTIVQVWTGSQAQTKCNHPAANNGSLRCLEAVWNGPLTGGVAPGSAPSFGLAAVGLSE